ncbi:MAG: exosortase family protein XrtF [Cyclobacteriaceae bacterium]|nr:exosortase family protein XrtF [Cyclobacteriaceae bacterium]
MINEFKPALRFLGIFVGLYLALNLLYGWWIEQYDRADPATVFVTNQSAVLLNVFGEDTYTKPKLNTRTISIYKGSRIVVNVFEGCNGINVAIVFVAFMAAFGGDRKKMLWFIPLGLALIHVANLFRVSGLFLVAEYFQQYFYYIHKYAFTASIYVMVFLLWWIWIEKINKISVRQVISSGKS